MTKKRVVNNKWIKLVDDSDLIIYEIQKRKDMFCRVEARNRGNFWEIYYSYIIKNKNLLVEEFITDTKEQVYDEIKKIMASDILDEKQIKKILLERNKNISIDFKRDFLKENIEKWYFKINGNEETNFILIKYNNDKINMDIVMNEKYKFIEKQILKKILEFFNLNEGDDISQDLYYFKSVRYYSLEWEDNLFDLINDQ